MALEENIYTDMKTALKAQDHIKLSTLRMLRSALHNRKIALKQETLADADVLDIVAKQVKKCRDAMTEFIKGGRQDLVDKEQSELAVLEGYLPPALSEDELQKIIRQVVQDTGAQGKKDTGKVMKGVMAQTRGRAEGKLISTLVNEALDG